MFLHTCLDQLPTAVWVGKMFHNIDVREHGSGNAGATNVIRVLGWKTGIPVLIIDLVKGWLAAMLPVFFNLADPGTALLTNLQILARSNCNTSVIFSLFLQDSGEEKALQRFRCTACNQPLAYNILHRSFSVQFFLLQDMFRSHR